MALAQTQYVRSGDADIAYQVIGDGPADLVLVLVWANHLEAVAELPMVAELVGALARFSRVIWFDMRGIGMSGPIEGGIAPVESWLDDVLTVLDAVGSEQAAFVAQGQAAQLAIVAAATHPERVASLVLVNGFARFARAADHPAGLPESAHEQWLDGVETLWGSGVLIDELLPSRAGKPGMREWWGRVERYGATPRQARARARAVLDLDVRHVLPLVRVPTLVIHNRDDRYVRIGHGRHLAEHIHGARLLERDSADHLPVPDPDLIGAIEEFVTGSRVSLADSDRILATVLFADVVASTEYASALGDRGWRAALERFEQVVRAALDLYGGRLENIAGDGILATFDGPARAIRCAHHLHDQVRIAGLEVRCGVHVGEVTRRPDGIAGLAVHIGARVAALAEPGEVLVTRTVRDLVAGSGIAFAERGEHELKGVPDRWTLYAASD